MNAETLPQEPTASERLLAVNLDTISDTERKTLIQDLIAEDEKDSNAFDAGETRDKSVIDTKAPYINAELFLREHYKIDLQTRLLNYWQDQFVCYKGPKWEILSIPAVRAEVYEFLASKYEVVKIDGQKVLLPVRPTRAMVDDLVDALKAKCFLEAPSVPCWLEKEGVPANELIAFRNGILHVSTRRLLQHTPHFFNFNALEFDYDPNAAFPVQWTEFLSQILENDTESIEALQEWFGLYLTPITYFQKILFIVGPPRSGKGTIARVLTALLGRDNVCNPTLAGLGLAFGLASLIGKLLAIISDARLGGRVDIASVTENLLRISGEDGLSVPRKFLSDWLGQLKSRILILANEILSMADASGALPNRFIVIKLRKSFLGQEDPLLTEKLLKELPGILNWALDGLERLLARGYLLQPLSASDAIEDLRALSSPVKAFCEDRCTLEPGAFVSCSAIFSQWKAWCDENNREHAGTPQSFGAKLSAVYPAIKSTRPSLNGRRERGYEGIRLRSCMDLDYDEAVGPDRSAGISIVHRA